MTPSKESILLRRCNKSVAGLSGVNTDSNDFFVVCGVLVVIHRPSNIRTKNVRCDFSWELSLLMFYSLTWKLLYLPHLLRP